jgi:cytidylate kinase
MAKSARIAVFLNGPIGAGKTCLGVALAQRLGGQFLDSDDFGDPSRPWYAQIKRSSERLLDACQEALGKGHLLFVAKPLRRRDWVYFRGKLAELGIRSICLTLSSSYEAVVDPARGRIFDEEERRRIKEMIEQGYASRAFSDLTIATDPTDFQSTLTRAVVALGPLLS